MRDFSDHRSPLSEMEAGIRGRAAPDLHRTDPVSSFTVDFAIPGTPERAGASPVEPVSADGDLPADTSTPATLALGETYSDELEIIGDRDWIAVELVAGQRYGISLDGTGGSPLSDPLVRLYNASGTLVAENDDGGPGYNSLLSYTVGTTGTYYVEAAAWDDSAAGGYTVGLETLDALTEYTNDQIADFLQSGYWTGNAAAPRNWSATDGGTITVNIVDLTADGQTLARAALQLWSDLTGITFSEVGVGGQMVFDDDQSGAFASTTNSGGITQSASINVSTAWLATYGTDLNTYSFQTYIHEIGHALGLGHAGPYNGSADYVVDAAYLNDSWQATIMSYFSQTENTYINGSFAFVVSPQMADVLAIQNMYGLAADIRSGNTVYGFNSTAGNAIYDATSFATITSYTIVDTDGKDTLDYSGSGANQTLDLREESYSSVQGGVGNVGIARGTKIENATGGSGDDTLIGTYARNTLIGGAGADTFYAGGGSDRVFGGEGNDIIHGEGGPDRLYGEDGDDDIYGGGGEDAIFGGDGADQLFGDKGRDDIRGNDGNDVMWGGGGSDYFRGGAGNDTIDGGLGAVDRAVYTGNFAEYSVTYNSGSGIVQVADERSGAPEGTDQLVSVEYLVFADGVVTVNGGNFDFEPDAAPVTLQLAADTELTSRVLADRAADAGLARGERADEGGAPAFVVDTPMDDISGNIYTTASMEVGETFHSFIYSFDHDWVKIELVAGESYEFALTGVGSVNLKDPYLELRDSAGNLIASDNDSGPGVNALLSFTASESGTYFLDVQAYFAEDGYYDLTAVLADPPLPSQAIDWGTQVDGSDFTIYFAVKDEFFDHHRAMRDWTAAEKAAVLAAFGVYADVADINFTVTDDQAEATFTLVKSHLDGDTLAYFNPPGETNAGVGVFNYLSSGWTEEGLVEGGFTFATVVHEIGHALGLAHPHDTGGESRILPGVIGPFGSYGDSELNQGVFTVMSYNDGWATGPNGLSDSQNFGWQATLGPLDIAVIQEKYGADLVAHTGNSAYALGDANGAGAHYAAIWDTAGIDTIIYSGTRNAWIDLRAATLLDEAGGGGFVSYVRGIIGGFTIANGVLVENAIGGSGNDWLRGNDADNIFTGNGGNDRIIGARGDDMAVFSGSQSDYRITTNGDGSLTVRDLRSGSPDGTDTLVSIETLHFVADSGPPPVRGEDFSGGPGRDMVTGTAGDDSISAGGGSDWVYAGDGNDTVLGQGGPDHLFGERGNDTMSGGGGDDAVYGGGGDDHLSGNRGRDDIRGGSGDDTLVGGGGSDFFRGGAGNDYISGGGGDFDRAIYDGNYADYSLYYNPGSDQVRLTDTRDGRPDGVDRLVDVELLVFADGVVTVNGGSFDFQSNAEPVTLPSAAVDSAAAQAFASLAMPSEVVKGGAAPVMDSLANGDDAPVLLVAGDGPGPLGVLSGIGRVADGWAVLDAGDGVRMLVSLAADPGLSRLAAGPVQAPEAAPDWQLLSEPVGEATGAANMPAVLPTDWITPADAWEVPQFDHQPDHDAGDPSGWM